MNSELRAVLAAHDGVVTRAQALSVGLSSAAIGRLTARGDWMRMGAGVYFAADREMSDHARMRIACAQIGAEAVLSGGGAAFWHRLIHKAPRTVSVTAPRSRGSTSPAGVRLVRRDLHPVDVVERSGLAVTGVALTVLEVASTSGMTVMDAALQRKRVSLKQLADAHRRYPGRRGAAATGRMLSAAVSGARSEAERLMHGILRTGPVTGWTANAEVCGYSVDVLFEEARVIIEIDGYAYHSDAEAFQHDRTRQNVLVGNGYVVLRFTWADLTERPEYVLAQILSAVSRNRG